MGLEEALNFTGIKVRLKKPVEKSQNLGPGMRAIKDQVYCILARGGLVGLVKDKAKIKEALEKTVAVAEKLEER